ncbi:MAG TPA: glutamate--tRNA ligase [Xenococcaceae cyanobacterium]
MTVRVRIAPSPTGNLHIGTARTAVFNWLYARHYDGKFILRIEDTDKARSRPEYTENITSGLTWLGLTWDEGPFFQTQRFDKYQQAIQTLLDQGLAYPCYCTPEELDQMREQQKAQGLAPRYDNRHRNLSAEAKAAFIAEGRQSVIRFKIDDEREIVWQDAIRGRVVWQGRDLGGDMVIARASENSSVGQPLYNLAVVVDDIDLAITHVIRGEDHIANTAKQILLYEAFGAKIPVFAHTPLILNQEGKKLSKRDGVTSIDEFRKMGFLPEALANYMTLLGWTPPDSTEEIFSLTAAAAKFDLDRVNKAGAKFDWAKLDWINSQYLHQMAASDLLELLVPYWEAAGYEVNLDRDRQWWETLTAMVTPNLTRLTDVVAETRLLIAESVEYTPEAREFMQQAGVKEIIEQVNQNLSEATALTESSAKTMIKDVTKNLKVKKGLVMRSLRAGLTGEMHGPDLIQSWILLHQKGWDRPRLAKALSLIQ